MGIYKNYRLLVIPCQTELGRRIIYIMKEYKVYRYENEDEEI